MERACLSLDSILVAKQMQSCTMPYFRQFHEARCPFMHTPTSLCAASCMSQAHVTVLHVGSIKSIRLQCSQNKHCAGNANTVLALVEALAQPKCDGMLVPSLLVLLSSSALRDTRHPFRLVLSGACVYMSLQRAVVLHAGCTKDALQLIRTANPLHVAHELTWQLLLNQEQP